MSGLRFLRFTDSRVRDNPRLKPQARSNSSLEFRRPVRLLNLSCKPALKLISMAEKDTDEKPNSSLLVGGAILAVVAIALIVTLSWYFMHYGKGFWH